MLLTTFTCNFSAAFVPQAQGRTPHVSCGFAMGVFSVLLCSLLLLAAGEFHDGQAVPVVPPGPSLREKWTDRLGTCFLTCLVLSAWRWRFDGSKEPKETHLLKCIGFAETMEEALSFVRVLCTGMSAFDCSSRVVQHEAVTSGDPPAPPILVVQTNGKLFGDFATRSRIPFNVVSDSAEKVAMLTSHARCRALRLPATVPSAPAAIGLALGRPVDGQPLGGPWAQVVVDTGGQLLALDAAPQVFAQEVDLAQLAGGADGCDGGWMLTGGTGVTEGKRVVYVDKNDVSSVDLKGAVAVLSEKHKPGTMSDGALLRGAYQAGAMLYCVPDPSEIPCFAISEDDGKRLCSALEAGRGSKVKEFKLHDRREKLQTERSLPTIGGLGWATVRSGSGDLCFEGGADSSKIRKLFTACTGPVGPVPRELWQQRDPTWRITDERNAVGMVVRTQGAAPGRVAAVAPGIPKFGANHGNDLKPGLINPWVD
eukprot:Skav228343  [mRNA]  locus=scaffold1898:169630:178000:- [translate_table: standard]